MEKVHFKKTLAQKIVYVLLVASFLTPIFYYIVKACMGQPSENAAAGTVHAFLGIFVLHLPFLASWLLRFEMPPAMDIYFGLFFYGSMFLGEYLNAYDRIPEWDTILHSTSAVALCFLGFMLFAVLGRNKKLDAKSAPLFAAVFAFCFAVTVGAMWEICEFTSDGVAGMDSQKFNTPDGVALVGRAALMDTMEDIIVDVAGSLVAAVIGFVSLVKKQTWLVPKFLPMWKTKGAKQETAAPVTAETEESEKYTEEEIPETVQL